MNHLTTPAFWKRYQVLPAEVQRLADRNFQRLKADWAHPSLAFKKIGNLWSVRVGLNYRALGLDKPEGVVWFWIGSHADYDALLP